MSWLLMTAWLLAASPTPTVPGFPRAGSPFSLPVGRAWLLLVPLLMVVVAALTLPLWRVDSRSE